LFATRLRAIAPRAIAGHPSLRWPALDFARLNRFALLVVAGSALAIGIARIAWFLLVPEYFVSSFGGDLWWQLGRTESWLAGDGWYMPYQLTGPYYNQSGNLYPPIVLALFVPFLVLPSALWWIIPIGVVGAFLWWTRPSAWGWALIGACLAFPAISIVHLTNGNTTMWVAMLIALGFKWPWVTGLIAPFKPSLVPFAFLGIRSRSWWIAAAVITAINIPLIPMWLEYVTVLLNAYGPQATPFYALRDLPLVAVPIIAWTLRRRGRRESSPVAAAHLRGGVHAIPGDRGGTLAPGHRRDDMDRRPVADRCREVGRLAVDEHVDMGSQPRARLDEPVAHPGSLRVEGQDHRLDRVGVDVVPSLDARKERQERTGQHDGGHAQSGLATASTAQISGRLPVTSRHDSPSSELCHS
jgi:hypothetical protein